jgi:hypothetical protein
MTANEKGGTGMLWVSIKTTYVHEGSKQLQVVRGQEAGGTVY